MSGIIRWRDLQNILVTEDQINLLAGLIINASLLNQFDGFTGTGTELNDAIINANSIVAHEAKDLATAHHLVPNTIDGGVLADNTVAINKLGFTPLVQSDYLSLTGMIDSLTLEHNQLNSEVQNLYGVLFPSITGDIASQFDQLVSHIEKLEDAHDSVAISYGNVYDATTDALSGATQIKVSLENIKEFRENDEIELRDTDSGPETRTISAVDYNSGTIAWTTPLVWDYRLVNDATIKNNRIKHVQQALERSLRTNTDTFTGRLTINQSSTDDGLVLNKTNTGYSFRFNDFSSKTAQDYRIELGLDDGTSVWELQDSSKRVAAQITDDGKAWFNEVSLEDRASLLKGKITKQDLTDNREWKLPNRSGFIGLGDLTFTELLKVSLISGTKRVSIAPGFMDDYTGERVSAWISQEEPCQFAGGEIDLQAKFLGDNQALSLGSKWQIVTIFINNNNNVEFFYGPQEDTKQEAIDEFINFIPSAYMKLAKLIVQGDGLGGILQTSIEILEDQRPFLTMGMSASYYDESITSLSGWSAGTVINLPANSKAGGLIQTYKPGRGQLEVYIDGIYQTLGIDYEETQGEPIGRVRVLKDVPTNSRITFRITYKAAAVTGGFDVPTLQSAYAAGPLISVSSILGPVTLTSFDEDVLMDIDGSVNITNKIYNLKSTVFQKISALTTDLDKNQLYVNNDGDLIYHKYLNPGSLHFNIIEEVRSAQSTIKVAFLNGSGAIIPKGRGVALHPTLPNAVTFCDTSNSLSTSRCIGVTMENIAIGQSGEVAIGGQFKLTGLGIAHNTVLVVDPRNPGHIVDKNSVNYLPTDEYMEVGVVDGGHLLLNFVHNPKVKKVWKIGIAGEAFNANETKLVRFAVGAEDRGRVYKADKALAHLEQKFWAVAAVNPSVAISPGDSIELLREVEMHSSEIAFSDQDMGKPFYLTNDGNFTSWRLLNGTFTLGDAAIKIGMIEDRRKFVIDGSQMMGTAPGATI